MEKKYVSKQICEKYADIFLQKKKYNKKTWNKIEKKSINIYRQK